MQEKHCHGCGRPILDVAKMEKNPDLRYCSKNCSQKKYDRRDAWIDTALRDYFREKPNADICPSQMSRSLFADNWKAEHQRVVMAARRLYLLGEIGIYQNKKIIADLNFKGPIRLRKR